MRLWPFTRVSATSWSAGTRTDAAHRWLLLLVAALALGSGLGLRDPSPPDEPRFALAAQQMVESGQWLIPHRGSEVYAEKPPPFMWLQALAYTAVGDWRIAFLLPSLLAALATLWLSQDLAGRLWNPRVARYAGWGLLACLQFGIQAKRAQIDMVLVFWTTLSLWGLCRHLLRGPDRRALLLGAFAAGLGTVTKGVGFLPLLIVLPWWLARRRHVSSHDDRRAGTDWLLASLGFVAGAAVWLAPMLLAVARSDDPQLHQYAAEILFHQTGTRYANAWHHLKPAWYYLQVIATLWLPGALLLPWLLPAWWRRIRRGDVRYAALVGWALLVVLFFTASPGKRGVYLLPALPALCIAAAPLLAGLLHRAGVRRLLVGYVAALSVLLIIATISGLLGAAWVDKIAMQRDLAPSVVTRLLLWLAVLGAAGLALLIPPMKQRLGAGGIAVGFNLLLWSVYGVGLAPALDASSSARGLMREVRAAIGPEGELGMVGWREQHLLQAVGPAREFGFKRPPREQWRDARNWAAAAPAQRWIFTLESAQGPCVDARQVVPLGRSSRREWVLVPGTALLAVPEPGGAGTQAACAALPTTSG